jgi:pimeloyl-ACP methyl ester carboxylesterase
MKRFPLRLAMLSTIAALAGFTAKRTNAQTPADDITVVLVHGAFADGSSWTKVIPLLEAQGLHVVAVQNPLTSLADDVASVKRAVEAQKGPVVLVGHSWAGMVITEAGASERVKALVYVAAFAPDEGQAAGELLKPYPPPPGLNHRVVDSAGFMRLADEDIAKYFAPELSSAEANLLAVTQGPIRAAAFGEKVSVAPWKTKPSWSIVAENDQMIPPSLERDEAKAIHAKTTFLPSSHVVMLSHPKEVAGVIIEAAESITDEQ